VLQSRACQQTISGGVMRALKWRILSVLLLSMSFVITGCDAMKAKSSKGAGFVPLEEMSKRPDLPFHNVWVKAGVDWRNYSTLYIKDTNVRFLLEANWWQQSIRKEKMTEDAHEIGLYMHKQFEKAFIKDPYRRFRIISSPEAGSLTLEMAITELVPSHQLLEALSIVAPYGSGVAVQAAANASGAKCTVAFEAKIIDNSNGQIIAMIADREQGKVAPVNLKALTVYGEARTIIDEWADQFVQVANKRPNEIVKDTSSFTLTPW